MRNYSFPEEDARVTEVTSALNSVLGLPQRDIRIRCSAECETLLDSLENGFSPESWDKQTSPPPGWSGYSAASWSPDGGGNTLLPIDPDKIDAALDQGGTEEQRLLLRSETPGDGDFSIEFDEVDFG